MTRVEQLIESIKNREVGKSFWLGLYMILALGLAGFHLYTAYFGVLPAWHQRSIHLALVLMVAFTVPFLKPGFDNRGELIKKCVSFVMLIMAGYFFYFVVTQFPAIQFRQGMPAQGDIIMALMLIAMLLIGSKMYMGWPLPIVAGSFILYAMIGPWMPGVFRHGGLSLNIFVDHLFITLSGIFGAALAASAVFIAIFLIFGQFLLQTKTGDYFVDLATGFAGKYTGGPAKTAVVASALLGTIHGSAVANVATSGVVTIPLMKKLGYKKEFAAGVEASASTGGIILPPIMGSAAFIMAEMSRIPYSRIILAALIPAILYFLAVFLMVHLEAKKENLEPVPKQDLPDAKMLFLKEGYLLLPILSIVVFLMMGYSPMRAGLFAIGVTIVLSMFRKKTRLNLVRLIAALEGGAKEIATIGLACGTAGIIAGLISLTGLGVKLAQAISMVAGDFVFLGLLMTMVVGIILGLGMPAPAAFVLVATIAASILTNMGIPELSAYMFIFYYSSLSAITPPVALASFTAAGIAQADQMKTCVQAVKLALTAYMIPFFFVYGPELLFEGTGFSILRAVITCLLGIACLTASVHGWNMKGPNHWISRIVLFAAAFLLMDTTNLFTDLAGIAVLVVVFLFEKKRYSKKSQPSEDSTI